MRIPKNFNVFVHADKSVHIILNNYDGNFLAFQILVLATPLLIAAIILAMDIGVGFFIVTALLGAVIYWCFYNYKDQTKFIFSEDRFIVKEGMHESVKLNVRKNEITGTETSRNSGKILTSARTASSAKTKPTYELYILTKDDKILVTKHVGPLGQEYLKQAIEAWIKKASV